MDTNYKQTTEKFCTYNINQTTIREDAHGKHCGSPPQPARAQQGQLISSSSSSRADRWVYFQQNAGLRLFVHT